LILLAYNSRYSDALLKYGADSRSGTLPAAIEETLRNTKGLNLLFVLESSEASSLTYGTAVH
uniref:ANF_receptor domain-containing protein n=1 Tax=Gongylonema pulchrum TaxID=637853 RepID=A0A183DDA5_9BILA